MNIIFKVKQTFSLTVRNVFVIAGTISSGEIRPGMLIREPSFDLAIDSIELVNNDNEDELIALLFSQKDEAKIGLLKNVKENDLLYIS